MLHNTSIDIYWTEKKSSKANRKMVETSIANNLAKRFSYTHFSMDCLDTAYIYVHPFVQITSLLYHFVLTMPWVTWHRAQGYEESSFLHKSAPRSEGEALVQHKSHPSDNQITCQCQMSKV